MDIILKRKNNENNNKTIESRLDFCHDIQLL